MESRINLKSPSYRQGYGSSDLFSSDGSRTLHPDGHLGNYVRAGMPAWEYSPGGSVYKRQCCCPHPDCPSGCLGDSGLTNTSGCDVAGLTSSLPLTPSQQAVVGPTASSHVHLRVFYKLSSHFTMATSLPSPGGRSESPLAGVLDGWEVSLK